MAETRFTFAFDTAYRVAGLPFGVTPSRTEVVVDDEHLRVRFGPWRLRTELSNVVGTELTGPFSFPKTAGPAHLSFSDRGLTMATNGRQGVCIRFRTPVPGIDPTGRIRHPGLTVTVADPQGLADRLQAV
jgi:hypothetical protein